MLICGCTTFVFCTDMFGVSDHDLMFVIGANKAVEADGDDDSDENVRFIQSTVRVAESAADCDSQLLTASCTGRQCNINNLYIQPSLKTCTTNSYCHCVNTKKLAVFCGSGLFH